MSVPPNDLSEREIEILRLVATGVGNKEIAQRLNISVNTVKVHLRNIFTKIGVTTRTEAAMYAVVTNLVEAQPAASELMENVFSEPSPYPVIQKAAEPPRALPRRIWIYLFAGMITTLGTILVVWLFGSMRPLQEAAISSKTPVAPAGPSATEPVWTSLAPLSMPRSNMGVVVYGNEIFTVGGKTASGVTGTLEHYNISENRWKTASSKNVPASHLQAAVLAGKIFVPGGEGESGIPTDVLEIYSPDEDRWTFGQSLPRPLSRYALTAFEGKLYAFGGWDGQEYQDTIYVYDPDDDRWDVRGSLSSPRGFAGATVAGGNIYLIGGYDGRSALRLNEMYLADKDQPGSEPWQARSALPESRYQMGVVNLADMVYVVGGRSDNRQNLNILNYLPTTDKWQQIQTPPRKQQGSIGLAGFGANLYIIGGESDNDLSSQVDAYQALYLLLLPILP